MLPFPEPGVDLQHQGETGLVCRSRARAKVQNGVADSRHPVPAMNRAFAVIALPLALAAGGVALALGGRQPSTMLAAAPTRPAFGPRSNRGRWRGQPFRHGIFDTHDGEVLAVWKDEDLQAVSYHHRLYMEPRHVEALDEHRADHFSVDDDGHIRVSWPPWWRRERGTPQALVRDARARITEQIEIR
jgi:hypothetical protein